MPPIKSVSVHHTCNCCIMRVIFVEGNIASGKSTLLGMLQTCGYSVIQEPVHLWHGHLGKLYGSCEKTWSLPVQLLSLTTRMEDLIRAERTQHSAIIERSIKSSDIFSKLTLDDKGLSAYKEVRDVYTTSFLEGLGSHTTVYLRSQPETCIERAKKRARESEAGIQDEFIRKLHLLHDEAFHGRVDLQLDVDNMTPEEVLERVITFVSKA